MKECFSHIGGDMRGYNHSCELPFGHNPTKHKCMCGKTWYDKMPEYYKKVLTT